VIVIAVVVVVVLSFMALRHCNSGLEASSSEEIAPCLIDESREVTDLSQPCEFVTMMNLNDSDELSDEQMEAQFE
jgi:hypothetical protein